MSIHGGVEKKGALGVEEAVGTKGEVAGDNLLNDRAPEAVALLVPVVIDDSEGLEVILENMIEGRRPRVSGPVDPFWQFFTQAPHPVHLFGLKTGIPSLPM